MAIGHVTVFVPVHDLLQVKIHWFKKLEFLWFRNSQSLFKCRWCNETEIKIRDISVLPVQAYLRRFDGY